MVPPKALRTLKLPGFKLLLKHIMNNIKLFAETPLNPPERGLSCFDLIGCKMNRDDTALGRRVKSPVTGI
jgi:hypothetical protein